MIQLTSDLFGTALRVCVIGLTLFMGLAHASDETVGGNGPLSITSDEFLNMKVKRNQVDQYFSTYRTYLRLGIGPSGSSEKHIAGSLSIENIAPWTPESGYEFIAQSHTSDKTTNPLSHTIVTVVKTPDSVFIAHTVTYAPGENIYRHQWVVTNSGQTDYSDISLRYGGDTLFGGNDLAYGNFISDNVGNVRVFCTSTANGAGSAGMQGDSGSPASGYYEDHYVKVWNALRGVADFSSGVNTGQVDNGMALEWRRPTLAKGESFTVVAYENWTDPGVIQVIAPIPSTHAAGDTFTLTFTVQNLQLDPASVTVDLVASGPTGLGWTVTSPSTVAVPGQGSATVDVQVTIPAGATSSGQVQLQLSSIDPQTQLARTHADRVTITVQGATVPPGPVVTVQSPGIQLSRGNQTIYTAISPSTPQGITSVMNALAGQSNTMLRAFAWDSYQGTYVELPNESPMGGVTTYTGIFIATRQPLNYSLNGSPTALPFAFTVIKGSDATQNPIPNRGATGWVFAGVPPVEISPGQYQTSFDWNNSSASAIVQVLYQGNVVGDTANLTTSTPSLADLMGTINSGDSTTSRPWWWNGSAYVQVPTLKCGEAYWFKNNSLNSDITIQVVRSNPVNALAAVRGGSEATPVVAKPIRLHDQGTPPPPPSASTTKASSSSKGGCGTGSGIASLVLLMFMVSLRFLIIARR